MTTKIITAALAFFTTFGFSALMMQFAYEKPTVGTYYLTSQRRSATGQKIYDLLRRDIKNGRERFARFAESEAYETSFTAAYSTAVGEYVNKSSGIDDSELPLEIQRAWRAHMKAWRDYDYFLTRAKDLSNDQNNERKLRRLDWQKTREINRTWYEVLDLAAGYNAVPRGAY
jgi:hypothetical protein